VNIFILTFINLNYFPNFNSFIQFILIMFIPTVSRSQWEYMKSLRQQNSPQSSRKTGKHYRVPTDSNKITTGYCYLKLFHCGLNLPIIAKSLGNSPTLAEVYWYAMTHKIAVSGDCDYVIKGNMIHIVPGIHNLWEIHSNLILNNTEAVMDFKVGGDFILFSDYWNTDVGPYKRGCRPIELDLHLETLYKNLDCNNLTLEQEAYIATPRDGFCYLRIFKMEYRRQYGSEMIAALGMWPMLSRLHDWLHCKFPNQDIEHMLDGIRCFRYTNCYHITTGLYKWTTVFQMNGMTLLTHDKPVGGSPDEVFLDKEVVYEPIASGVESEFEKKWKAATIHSKHNHLLEYTNEIMLKYNWYVSFSDLLRPGAVPVWMLIYNSIITVSLIFLPAFYSRQGLCILTPCVTSVDYCVRFIEFLSLSFIETIAVQLFTRFGGLWTSIFFQPYLQLVTYWVLSGCYSGWYMFAIWISHFFVTNFTNVYTERVFDYLFKIHIYIYGSIKFHNLEILPSYIVVNTLLFYVLSNISLWFWPILYIAFWGVIGETIFKDYGPYIFQADSLERDPQHVSLMRCLSFEQKRYITYIQPRLINGMVRIFCSLSLRRSILIPVEVYHITYEHLRDLLRRQRTLDFDAFRQRMQVRLALNVNGPGRLVNVTNGVLVLSTIFTSVLSPGNLIGDLTRRLRFNALQNHPNNMILGLLMYFMRPVAAYGMDERPKTNYSGIFAVLFWICIFIAKFVYENKQEIISLLSKNKKKRKEKEDSFPDLGDMEFQSQPTETNIIPQLEELRDVVTSVTGKKDKFDELTTYLDTAADVYAILRTLQSSITPNDLKVVQACRLMKKLYFMATLLGDCNLSDKFCLGFFGKKTELQALTDATMVPEWLLNLNSSYDVGKKVFYDNMRKPIIATISLVSVFLSSKFIKTKMSTVTASDLYDTMRRELATQHSLTFECYFDAMFCLVRRVLMYTYTGYWTWDNVVAVENEYLSLISSYAKLDSGELTEGDHAPTRTLQNLINRTDATIAKFKRESALTKNDIEGNNLRLRFARYTKTLEDYKSKARARLASSTSKLAPATVTLFGLPGVGKSTCVENVMLVLNKAYCDTTGKEVELTTARVQDNDKYDSVVYNETNAVLMDDALICSINEEAKKTFVDKLFRYNSSTRVPALKADVSEKSNTWVNNHILVITTNVQSLQAKELVSFPQAITRRMGLKLEVKVKDEYCLPNSTLPDKDKLRDLPVTALPSHLLYREYDFSSEFSTSTHNKSFEQITVPNKEYGASPEGWMDHTQAFARMYDYSSLHFRQQTAVVNSGRSEIICKECKQFKCADIDLCTCSPVNDYEHQSLLSIVGGSFFYDMIRLYMWNKYVECCANYLEEYQQLINAMCFILVILSLCHSLFMFYAIVFIWFVLALFIRTTTEVLRMPVLRVNTVASSIISRFSGVSLTSPVVWFSALALSGSAYYLFRKKFKATAESIFQASVETKLAAMNEARETYVSPRLYKAPCSDQKVISTDLDQMTDKVTRCITHVSVTTRSGATTHVYGLVINDQLVAVPAHIFGRRPDPGELYTMRFDFLGTIFNKEIPGSHVSYVPKKDIALLQVELFHKLKIRAYDLLADKNAVGSLNVRWVRPRSREDRELINIDLYANVSDGVPTYVNDGYHDMHYKPLRYKIIDDQGFNGLCGTPLFSKDSPRCIVGFHVLGGPTGMCACTISKEDISYFYQKSILFEPNKYEGVPQQKLEKPTMVSDKVEDIHFKNPIHHMAMPVEVVGAIPSKYSNKARILKYPVSDVVLDSFLEPKDFSVGPDMRETYVYRSFLHLSTESQGIPDHILQLAVEDFCKPIDELVSQWNDVKEYMVPLTMDECVNGKKMINVNSLNLKASAGFCSSGKKMSYVEGVPGSRTLKQEMVAELEAYLKKVKDKVSPGCVTSGTLKVEPMALKDGQKKLARVFGVPEMAETLAQKMYFAPCFSFFGVHCKEFENALGISALSPDWTELFDEFFDVQPNEPVTSRLWTCDYSKFDTCLNTRLLSAVGKVLIRVLKHFYDDEQVYMAERVYAEILNPIMSCKDALVAPDNYMASGIFLTSLVNSIANSLIMRSAFFTVMDSSCDFRSYHKIRVLGDDLMVRDTHLVDPNKFNPKVFSRICDSFEFKVVNPSDKNLPPDYCDPKQAEFLSRKTVYNEHYGCLMGALKPTSLQRAISAYNPQGNISLIDRFSGVSLSVLHEAIAYGPEEYKKMQYLLVWCYQAMGIPLNNHITKPYENHNVRASDVPVNKHRYPFANMSLSIGMKPLPEVYDIFQAAYPDVPFVHYKDNDTLLFYSDYSIDFSQLKYQAESSAGAIPLADATVTASGISNMVVPTPEVLAIPSNDYLKISSDPSLDLNTIPGRRTKILREDVPINEITTYIFDPFVKYMELTDILSRTQNHAYIRFNIKLTVTFIVAGDHYGGASISYYPLSLRTSANPALNDKIDTLWDSTMNMKMIDITKSSTIEYHVPFIWPFNMYELMPAQNLLLPQAGTFGSVQIRTFVPFRSTSLSHQGPVTMEVFAEAEEVMLGGPSVNYIQAESFPNEKPSVMLEKASLIAGSAADLFKGTIAYLPSKIASITLSGASQVAASMGYSKPRQLEYKEFLTRGEVGTLSSTASITNARMLGPERTHETNINPSITGLKSEDKLMIENLGRTRSIVKVIEISTTQTIGRVGEFPVTCAYFITSNSKVALTPPAAAALNFSFWTGGVICYKFTVIKHPSHGGVIAFSHDPSSYPNIASSRYNKTHRIDLRTEESVEVRVAWNSNKPSLLVRQGMGTPADIQTCNGFVSVHLETPIYSTGTAPAFVSLVVEYWWEDVVLYGPTTEFFDAYNIDFDWSSIESSVAIESSTMGDIYYDNSNTQVTTPTSPPDVTVDQPGGLTAKLPNLLDDLLTGIAVGTTLANTNVKISKPPSTISINTRDLVSKPAPNPPKTIVSSTQVRALGVSATSPAITYGLPHIFVSIKDNLGKNITVWPNSWNGKYGIYANQYFEVEAWLLVKDGVAEIAGGPGEGTWEIYDQNKKFLARLKQNNVTPSNGLIYSVVKLDTGIKKTGLVKVKLFTKTTSTNTEWIGQGAFWQNSVDGIKYRGGDGSKAVVAGSISVLQNTPPVALAVKPLDLRNIASTVDGYRFEKGFKYNYVATTKWTTQPPFCVVMTGSGTITNGSETTDFEQWNQPVMICIVPKGDIIFAGNFVTYGFAWYVGSDVQSEFLVSGSHSDVKHVVDTMAGERVLSLRSLMKLPSNSVTVELSKDKTYYVSGLPRRGIKPASCYNLMTLAHLGVTGSVCFLIEICSNNSIMVARRNPMGGLSTMNFEICKPQGSRLYLFEVPYYAREKFYVPRGATSPEDTVYWGADNDYKNIGMHPLGLQITTYDPTNSYDATCVLKIWTYAGESFNPAGFMHIPAIIAPSSSVAVAL